MFSGRHRNATEDGPLAVGGKRRPGNDTSRLRASCEPVLMSKSCGRPPNRADGEILLTLPRRRDPHAKKSAGFQEKKKGTSARDEAEPSRTSFGNVLPRLADFFRFPRRLHARNRSPIRGRSVKKIVGKDIESAARLEGGRDVPVRAGFGKSLRGDLFRAPVRAMSRSHSLHRNGNE